MCLCPELEGQGYVKEGLSAHLAQTEVNITSIMKKQSTQTSCEVLEIMEQETRLMILSPEYPWHITPLPNYSNVQSDLPYRRTRIIRIVREVDMAPGIHERFTKILLEGMKA